MKENKVIIFMVEGPSDEDALVCLLYTSDAADE